MHEICIDFWRDIQKLVHEAILKLYFEGSDAVIISHRTQNTGLDGLSFDEYHQFLTRLQTG